MKVLMSCVVFLCLAVSSFGADYEYKLPLDDPNVMPVISLPDVGKTVKLVCSVRYNEDWPALRLGDAFIYQTWNVPRDYEPSFPLPKSHGKFNLGSYKQELIDGGRIVVVEFEIPDEVTTFQLQFYTTQFSCAAGRVFHKLRQYQFAVRPSITWEEKVESLPYELAPGLKK